MPQRVGNAAREHLVGAAAAASTRLQDVVWKAGFASPLIPSKQSNRPRNSLRDRLRVCSETCAPVRNCAELSCNKLTVPLHSLVSAIRENAATATGRRSRHQRKDSSNLARN